MSIPRPVRYRSNFQKSGRRGTLHMEHARLESEIGSWSLVAASGADTTFIIVPSNKTFHLKTIIADGELVTSAARVLLFASDGAGIQRLDFIVPAASNFILGGPLGGGDILGLRFGAGGIGSTSTGGVYARVSASASVPMFIGGLLRDADTGGTLGGT